MLMKKKPKRYQVFSGWLTSKDEISTWEEKFTAGRYMVLAEEYDAVVAKLLIYRLHELAGAENCDASPYDEMEEAANQLTLQAERLAVVEKRKDSLFEAIRHGNAEHELWLEIAIADHFAGKPVQTPGGSRKGA